MAKINQALLNRLADKLGVTKARIYALIKDSATKNRLPRHLAALLVAGDNDISIQKYATEKELADLRGVPSHVPMTVTPAPAAAISTRRAMPARMRKAKDNTVFVVHGRDSNLRDAMYQFHSSSRSTNARRVLPVSVRNSSGLAFQNRMR
jgi:hypothetical protein